MYLLMEWNGIQPPPQPYQKMSEITPLKMAHWFIEVMDGPTNLQFYVRHIFSNPNDRLCRHTMRRDDMQNVTKVLAKIYSFFFG